MAKKKPYNFTIFQGDDHSFSVTIKDAAGAVIDLTGWDFKLQAREDYDTEDTVLNLSVGSGIEFVAGTGVVTVSIGAAASADIAAGFYVYDLERTDDAGLKRKIVFGKMEVLSEVTKT